MKNILICAAFCCLTGCTKESTQIIPTSPQATSNFSIELNGISLRGSGRAFVSGDTALALNGTFDQNGYQKEIGIQITAVASGIYHLPKGSAWLADISGGDIVFGAHQSFGVPSDSLIICLNPSDRIMIGNCSFVLIDSTAHDTITARKGNFTIYY